MVIRRTYPEAEENGTFLERLATLLDRWEQSTYARLAAPALFTLMGAVITTHYASFADPAELGNPLLMSICVLAAFAASFTRHRFPRASLAVESAVGIVAGLNGWSHLVFFSFALGVYRVVARCEPPDAAVGTALAYGCYCLVPFLAGRSSSALVVGMTTWYVLVVLFALVSRMLHKRQVAVQQAREEHEARQRAEARRAMAERKNRIAGELHDSVGHDLTAIVALSEGLETAIEDEELARALASINELARAGLADTRRAVRELSDAGDSTQEGTDVPEHGIGDVKRLLATARETGVAAAFVETGRRPGDPAREDLAFRVAREGVTNALRHARDMTRLTVSLDHREDGSSVLAVRDDGRQGDGMSDGDGSAGIGLARLRALVEDAGGSLSAGYTGGGWELRAEIAARTTLSGKAQGAEEANGEEP